MASSRWRSAGAQVVVSWGRSHLCSRQLGLLLLLCYHSPVVRARIARHCSHPAGVVAAAGSPRQASTRTRQMQRVETHHRCSHADTTDARGRWPDCAVVPAQVVEGDRRARVLRRQIHQSQSQSAEANWAGQRSQRQ